MVLNKLFINYFVNSINLKKLTKINYNNINTYFLKNNIKFNYTNKFLLNQIFFIKYSIFFFNFFLTNLSYIFNIFSTANFIRNQNNLVIKNNFISV